VVNLSAAAEEGTKLTFSPSATFVLTIGRTVEGPDGPVEELFEIDITATVEIELDLLMTRRGLLRRREVRGDLGVVRWGGEATLRPEPGERFTVKATPLAKV